MKIESVIKCVNQFYGVNIRVSGRQVKLVRARHVAMYLLCKSGHTEVEIGEAFGKHPSTVHHAIKTINGRFSDYEDELNSVTQAVKKIKGECVSKEFYLASSDQIFSEVDRLNDLGNPVYTTAEKYMMLRGFIVATRSSL